MHLPDFIAAIFWDPSREIFTIGGFSLRWYSVGFICSFLIGYYIVKSFFKRDGIDERYLDGLLIVIVISGILGARLGEVFFYSWPDFRDNPARILRIWEGGLASHGGAIGVILAVTLYARFYMKVNPLWLLDRVLIPTALAGMFIRIGNFFNQEIYGIPTGSDYGVIFGALNDGLPRHPTQLYEAGAYLLIFIGMMYAYHKTNAKYWTGFITGVFLTLMGTVRIVLEFWKPHQGKLDSDMALNMGSVLSIPIVLAGIALALWAYNRRKKVVTRSSPEI